MPNYQETNITGSKYRRVRRIVAENALGTMPLITFIEEEVIVLSGGDTVTRPLGVVQVDLSVPTTEFNVLNPTDDSTIGTAQYQEVYALLYSLYRHLAAQRDNA